MRHVTTRSGLLISASLDATLRVWNMEALAPLVTVAVQARVHDMGVFKVSLLTHDGGGVGR
jgi:hypothetical protein